MNKIKLLKFSDGIIGRAFVFLLPRIKRPDKDNPKNSKKILLIRPGGIGDAVLLLPAIDALKSRFPDSDIDVLCEKRNAEIFMLSNIIGRIFLYDRGLDLFRSLRNKYDVVIDTEQWHRLSAVAAYLSGAPIRIGFGTNEREKLFTHRISYSHEDYEVYSFLQLIEPLIDRNYDFKGGEPFIRIKNDVASHFQDELKNKGKVIAIFSGASVTERRWGGDKFGAVAKILSDKGYDIIILGSDADRADAERIKKHAGSCVDLTGRTNLRDIAAVLKESRLLITADSGLMHIAYAVGTPTVSLFGSGIEKKWAPRGENHIVLNKHLDCSPCTKFGYTPCCKRNVECLSLISVEDVVAAVKTILGEA